MNLHSGRGRTAVQRRLGALAPVGVAIGLVTASLLGSAGAAAGAAPASGGGSGSHAHRALAGIGGQFAIWAQAPGVKVVSGDVNHDGRADLMLTGGPGWNTLPVGFSRGNGTFRVTNEAI